MDARKLLLAAATLAFFSPLNSTPASAQTISFSAVLLGGNECDGIAPPAGPKCRKGDADGFGRATVTFPTSALICVTLQVDNLSGVTAAHIHPGRATFNGDPIFNIIPPAPSGGGNPKAVGMCAAPPAGLQAAIRANPANFYINVHTSAMPNGALRGQLF